MRWIDRDHDSLSVRRQCELLGIHRSQLYYEPVPETDENLGLMRLLDEQYLKTPFWGSRNMTFFLRKRGHPVNRKRTQRLLRKMGLAGWHRDHQQAARHPATRSIHTYSMTS